MRPCPPPPPLLYLHHQSPAWKGNNGSFPALLLSVILSSFGTRAGLADTINPAQPASPPALTELQQGVSAVAAEDLAEAERRFERSLELDPNSVSALVALADVSIQKGDMARASKYLGQAARLSPNDAGVLTARGRFLSVQKDYREAEKALKAAIAANPRLERPRYELGNVYLLGFHKPKDAIDAYRSALAIDPNDVRVRFTLANVLAQSGQLDDAQQQLEEASRLSPKNLVVLKFLGDLYVRRGKLEQAQGTYAKALAIDPHFLPAAMAQADLFVMQRNPDQALARYRAIIEISPRSAPALVKIGMIDEMKGRWNEAEQAYRQALAADPHLAMAANNLACLLNDHGNKPAEALTWATKAVELSPKDVNTLDTLGWVLRANGDSQRALLTLKKASAAAPANPQVLYHLGVAYQEAKQPQAASQSFSRALELSRNFESAADAQSRLVAIQKLQSTTKR